MIRNVALIVLYNRDKKILLQHRDENIPRLPGYWGFFGGGMEEGETVIEAAKREIKEELNYDLKNPRLVMIQQFSGQGEEGLKYIFLEEYSPRQKLTLREGQGMQWFKISETDKLKIIDHDRDVLDYLEKKVEF